MYGELMNRNMELALRKARVKILNGDYRYICLALSRVGWEHPDLLPATEVLKDYIRKKLDGFGYLEDWLVYKRYATKCDIGRCENILHRRDLRIRWIDWMLGDETHTWDVS